MAITSAQAPRAFHLLSKPTGAICNLDCSYCFFLSKEMLYPGSRFRMADDLLEAYIRQLLEAHPDGQEVAVAWQGGEPTLMGVEFFRRSVELVEQHRRPGQTVAYTIQTNGTKLDDEWCEFLKEHDFLVGLSVDGPREIHDAYRVNKGGKGSFDEVMGGWRKLVEHGVEFNILCTVHDRNADRGAEVYRFFRDELGATFVQFIPIIERVADPSLGTEPWSSWRDRPLYQQEGEIVTTRSVGWEQWGEFLVDVFEEWVRRDVGTVYRADVRRRARELGGRASESLHPLRDVRRRARARAHRRPVLLRPLRRAAPPAREHQGAAHARARRIAEAGRVRAREARHLPRYCLDCDVRFACHGGCPKDRFIETPDGEPGLNYLCAGYKRYFHHVDRPMRIMGDLLRQGRAPSEIMQLYAAEDAARGRNDPCTCGSGKKWKRCHGAS